MERIAECGEIRMGYGKSSEFGAVEFELVCAEPLKTVSKTCTDAIVTLASDVLLYNEMGMLTTDVRVLEKTLREMTGAKDSDTESSIPEIRDNWWVQCYLEAEKASLSCAWKGEYIPDSFRERNRHRNSERGICRRTRE